MPFGPMAVLNIKRACEVGIIDDFLGFEAVITWLDHGHPVMRSEGFDGTDWGFWRAAIFIRHFRQN